MPDVKDLVRMQLANSRSLIEMFTKELTDEEYFKAAVPGANHAGWIVGHLAVSEDSMCSKIACEPIRLPQEMHDKFNGNTECYPGPGNYPSRRQISEMFHTTREHSLKQLDAFDLSKWDVDSPDIYPREFPREFFPTNGSVWSMMGAHQFWHIGQLTTNRVALKKPRAFG